MAAEFQQYVEHGWKLCAIDKGRKAPVYDDWNTPAKAITDPETASGLDGAGLIHALSGTCALDIDDMEKALPWLTERGVDLQGLLAAPDAVRIESGRPGRSKLLYRLSRPLRTYQPKGSGLELRCSSNRGSVQDVLPPSMHPDTRKPYRWAYGDDLVGDWRHPPAIPPTLLALWRQLDTEQPEAAVRTRELPPEEHIQITRLRKWIATRDPDMEYEDWVKVGMKLHDATGGAQEAFDLWDEWSQGGTRKTSKGSPVYAGKSTLLTHWHSFQSAPGKVVASLHRELPAEPEEFPEETPATPDEETTEKLMAEAATSKRQDAMAALEKRLVYVYAAERYFDCDRHKIIGSDSALEHMFTWMMPKNKGGRLNPVALLKQSGTKRYVDSIGFHPGEGPIFSDRYSGDKYANAYRNRLPEPIEPHPGDIERIDWIFNRVDDPDFRDWLLMFYAHVVQKPGVKIKSAPLLWSEIQGNGKTTLMRMIPALLVGFQYSREVNSGLLNSDFNDYLLNAWHVNLTEFRGGSRGERESNSKKVESWIADDTIAIHPKGMPGWTMPNHTFITGSSNYDDSAAISNADRKWAIHELHAPQFTEAEQQYLYHDFLLTPRAAGVLRYFFLNLVSTRGFNPSAKAPDTASRQEMVAASTTADLEAITIAFETADDIFARDVVLTHSAAAYARKHSRTNPSVTRIGRLLVQPPFNGKAIQFRCGNGKFRAIVLRNHSRWAGAVGADIMAHIDGNDVDLTA